MFKLNAYRFSVSLAGYVVHRKALLLCTIISASSMAALSLNVLAEEATGLSCPDLSVHTKVLQQGQQALEALPPVYKFDQQDGLIELGTSTKYADSQDTDLDDAQLDNLKLDHARDFEIATGLVFLLETEARFESAEKLLLRQLEALRGHRIFDVADTAETLARLGHLQILEFIDRNEFVDVKSLVASQKYHSEIGNRTRFGANKQLDVIPYLESELNQDPEKTSAKWNGAFKFYDEGYQLQKAAKCAIVAEPEHIALLEAKGRLGEAKTVCLEGLSNFKNCPIDLALTVARFCMRQDELELAKQLEPFLVKSSNKASTILLAYYLRYAHTQEALDFFIAARDSEGVHLPQATMFRLDDTAAVIALLPNSQKEPLRVYVQNRLVTPAYCDQSETILTAASRRWENFDWDVFESLKKQSLQLMDLPAVILLAHHFAQHGQINHSIAAYTSVLGTLSKPLEGNFNKKNDMSISLMKFVKKDSLQKTTDGLALFERVSRLRSECEKGVQIKECLFTSKQLDETGSKLELQESYREAERMYRESLIIKEKNLSASDEEVVATCGDLARVLGEEGKVTEASALYERSLASYRKGLVQKDGRYAQLLDSYAQCLARNRQAKKAEIVYSEARSYHNSLAASRLLSH